MIRLITLLTMLALVAAPLVDVTVLDAAPLEVSGVPVDADQDRSDVPENLPFDNCINHCGCHTLHHMASFVQTVEILPLLLSGPVLPHQNNNRESLNSGPPVPPPLA